MTGTSAHLIRRPTTSDPWPWPSRRRTISIDDDRYEGRASTQLFSLGLLTITQSAQCAAELHRDGSDICGGHVQYAKRQRTLCPLWRRSW
eukprot:scaffold17575_cov33-Tisochrysis_lutea.AAC.5